MPIYTLKVGKLELIAIMQPTIIFSEIKYRFSTSSGKGGQHVNKVNTKVLACWNLLASKGLSAEEKELLSKNLTKEISELGEICITSQRTRSQLKNKQDTIDKLFVLIQKGLIVPKKRKKTKVPKAVKNKIKRNKQLKSSLKESRKKIQPPYSGN